jgi:flavin-dependent dehydrogenase
LAAREAARQGLQTLFVDKSAFPRSKVCGGCLNACAVSTLERIGLADAVRNLGAQEIEQIEIAAAHGSARLPLPGGLSVSRRRFDGMLIEAAIGAGAAFLSEARAQIGACRDDDRQLTLAHAGDRITVAARVVILASGLSGLTKIPDRKLRPTISRHSYIGAGCLASCSDSSLAPGTIQMACGRDGYVGIVRVEQSMLNLAAALDPSFVKRSGGVGKAAMQVIQQAGFEPPAVTAELRWRGTPLLTRRARRVAAPRLLVVGDAAGYVEPFTGEGMSWALAGGRSVASIIRDVRSGWDVEMERRWTRTHRRMIYHRQWLCRGVAWWLRHPAVFRWSLHLLRRNPGVAQPLIQHLNRPYAEVCPCR